MVITLSGSWGDALMAAVGAACMLAVVLLCVFLRAVRRAQQQAHR